MNSRTNGWEPFIIGGPPKALPALITMSKGLVRSLRAISSSLLLTTLMVYVWGILLHMLMKDEESSLVPRGNVYLVIWRAVVVEIATP